MLGEFERQNSFFAVLVSKQVCSSSDLLRNESLIVGQLRAPDVVYITTDVQTVIYLFITQHGTARADLFLKHTSS